jgi:hypothetical protein
LRQVDRDDRRIIHIDAATEQAYSISTFNFESFRFESFRFESFRFESFRFESFRFESFRFDTVSVEAPWAALPQAPQQCQVAA